MTENNWKPGDVAKLGSFRVFYSEDFDPEKPHRWQFSDGSSSEANDKNTERARPLVVIDPEERAQVETLADALVRARSGLPVGNAYPEQVDAMQRALREFANPTPPRPEEPTGLGAVVKGESGRTWVRVHSILGAQWRDVHGSLWEWDQVEAVQVLSEGVPA